MTNGKKFQFDVKTGEDGGLVYTPVQSWVIKMIMTALALPFKIVPLEFCENNGLRVPESYKHHVEFNNKHGLTLDPGAPQEYAEFRAFYESAGEEESVVVKIVYPESGKSEVFTRVRKISP